ncbi:MAG: PQ-loop repeat-containing protein [Candidatus Methylomirabilales bacterium]
MTINWLGYGGTALVILAYLPQILHLMREHCSAGLSVRAFLMWGTSAVLLLSYAISLGDGVFIALQGYQLVATMLICFYCKKYEHSTCEDHVGSRT